MKKVVILFAIIFFIPSPSSAAALTPQQAGSLIAVVQSSPGIPASVFVPFITAFSSITTSQASSLISVVQAAPGVPAAAFTELLVTFTVDTVSQSHTQDSLSPKTSIIPSQVSSSTEQPTTPISVPSSVNKVPKLVEKASLMAMKSYRYANQTIANPGATHIGDFTLTVPSGLVNIKTINIGFNSDPATKISNLSLKSYSGASIGQKLTSVSSNNSFPVNVKITSQELANGLDSVSPLTVEIWADIKSDIGYGEITPILKADTGGTDSVGNWVSIGSDVILQKITVQQDSTAPIISAAELRLDGGVWKFMVTANEPLDVSKTQFYSWSPGPGASINSDGVGYLCDLTKGPCEQYVTPLPFDLGDDVVNTEKDGRNISGATVLGCMGGPCNTYFVSITNLVSLLNSSHIMNVGRQVPTLRFEAKIFDLSGNPAMSNQIDFYKVSDGSSAGWYSGQNVYPL